MRKITTLLMLCLVCIGLNAQVYPISFDVNATKTGRYVTNVKLTSPAHGEQTIDISSTQTKVYNDYTSQSFTIAAGETVTPYIGYTASWMHGYVYIDLDNNGSFDVTDVNSEELVSFVYYEGKNSLGQSVVESTNATNPPAFTAPSTPGTYYMRFNVAWNSINPAGYDDILTNQGSVIDVKVVVTEPVAAPIVTEGKYYTLECYSSAAHSTTRFIADNGTVIDGRSAEGSAFTFEAAGDGGYYMKSHKSGKYLNCDTSTKNIYASSEKITSWVLNEPFSGKVSLSAGSDLYLNNNGSKCADGSTTNLQANPHTGGPAEGNACSLWDLEEVEVFIPVIANGVYEIQNQDSNGSRGYLVHSTAYAGKIKLAESKLSGYTSTDHAFASRTESGVTPYWYVYSTELATYIFSLADGKFIVNPGTGAAALSETPQAVVIEENGTTFKIKSSTTTAYLTAAVGWGQANDNVLWNNENGDGGHPYSFNAASVEVDASMLNTAIAAIEALESEPEPVYVTDLANLSNNKLYTILNGRNGGGLLYHASSPDLVAWNGKAGYNDVPYDINTTNYQWAIYKSANENYYLYNIAAQKYVGANGESNGAIPFVTEITNSIEITNRSNVTGYPFMMTGSENPDIMNTSANTGFAGSGLINWDGGYTDVNDAGNAFVFEEAGDIDAATLAKIEAAVAAFEYVAPTVTEEEMNALLTLTAQALAQTGVGYPTADCAERTALVAAKDAVTDKTSKEQYDNLAAALTAFANTSTINLPEDGKAYTFTNVQKNGTKYYLNYDAVDGVTMSTEAAKATTYVCKDLGEGKFMFVNNDGKYLIVKGSDAGGNSNSGSMDTYEGLYTALTVAKLAGGSVTPSSPADIFGYVSVMGKRNDGTSNLYFVIKSDGNFDQAGGAFFNDGYSSAFQLVEATYPNKPVMKAANGVTNGEEAIAAVATYCAPFATVLPAGVNAYYATSDEGHYVKLTLLDGAIPANTGVLLTATDDALVDQTVVMVPAAAEEQGTADGNLLAADAAKGEYTVDAEVNAYVVGKSGETVGFYPLSATNRTIAQGKAYLVLDQALSAVKFYFGGDDVTGIEAVEKAENANAPIFDLSGRRVVKAAKGGIYIQNGKKFIVK